MDKDPPAADPLEAVQILEGGECFTYVSALLPLAERFELQKVLQQNRDIFAWAHSDMSRKLLSVASHRLNVLSTSKPVRQKSRRFHPNKESTPDDWWSLHVDRASHSSGSGVGLLLKAPTGERLEQSIRLDFPASNNEAEYEAILSGLGLAITLNASKVKIHNDSQLVVGQIRKEYKAKETSA